jgi:hypothetical protein
VNGTRVLFFTWPSVLRRYAELVSELAGGGHEVMIASPSTERQKLPDELRAVPGVGLVGYDEVSDTAFGMGIGLIRNTRDYLWYLSSEQRDSSFNRRHALDRLVRRATGDGRQADPSWPDPILALSSEERAALDANLDELERRIPPDPGVVALIKAHRPDVVLVSPLVKQQFHQAEVVKAAASLGVPTGFLTYSWDNLSNKGRVHVAPDRTFVWNELQRREAIELHGLDPESIVLTGAPHWDAFFRMRPSTRLEDFCAAHGFDPARPTVLYLGSTRRICPDEPRVVEEWLAAVRHAAAPLRLVNILIRRHPDDKEPWSGWEPPGERISLSRHPRQQDQTLYDELHHSAAVVGLNTSAQIEASILGKPVYTFAAGALAPGQAGTLHFHYLLKEHGGVVTFSETLTDHVDRLGQAVTGDYDRDAIHRFREAFVRPLGLDRPVAPILAGQLLELARAEQRKRTPFARLRPRPNDGSHAGNVAKATG